MKTFFTLLKCCEISDIRQLVLFEFWQKIRNTSTAKDILHQPKYLDTVLVAWNLWFMFVLLSIVLLPLHTI